MKESSPPSAGEDTGHPGASWSGRSLQLLMEGDGNPKHCPLTVSAVSPAAPPRMHLAISQGPVSAEVDICKMCRDSLLALMEILMLQKGLATSHKGAFSVGC